METEMTTPVRPAPVRTRRKKPARVRQRSLKVALPVTAFTVVVPPRMAPAALPGDRATLTSPRKADTGLPLASRTETATVNELPAAIAVGGGVATASLAAVGDTLRMRLLSVS